MNVQPSVTDLLDNISQLGKNDFEVFFREILSLRARRVAQVLPQAESVLLGNVYQHLPDDIEQRYEVLSEKRQAQTIQPDEYTELLKLVDIVEKYNVQRLQYIVELANLRKMTVQDLMQQLGLMPLHNA